MIEYFARRTGLVDGKAFHKKECNRINTEFVEYMVPESTKEEKKAKVEWLNKRDQDRFNGIDPDIYHE